MKTKYVAALIALCTTLATAQQPAKAPEPDYSKFKVLIGTGGETGTYHTMIGKELAANCAVGDTMFGFKPQPGGTLANIDGVLSNKLDGGVGQEDSLFLKKATNPEVNQLKTLVTLHPEEVHVFVKADARGPEKVTPRDVMAGRLSETHSPGDPIGSVEQTAGMKIAAWGGSYDTARLISANAGFKWEVQQFSDDKSAFAALDKGVVQGIVAVAGAPSGAFESLPATYKLVGFASEQTLARLVAIYNGGAVLNYTNLRSEGVKTISTNAVLFTREFSDPTMLAALAQFRACFQQAVPSLRDARGSHKKWRQVNVANKGKWPWYELPAVAAAPRKK